jgi:hypothetical protein
MTTFTFYYEKDGISFFPKDEDLETEDIEAPTYQQAKREFERRHGNSDNVVKVSYPMSELEANGYQLGDGWPV